MVRLIKNRIFESIPTLILLATLTFFTLRLAPGGPFDGEKKLPPEILANLEAKYGLSDPLPVQYVHWMLDVARGDFKESFQYVGQPVSQIILQSFGVTAVLGLSALAFAILLGIPLGVLAAWKRRSLVDYFAVFLASSGVSLPSYLVASLLVLFFSLGLGWLPPALWEGPSSLILPCITLGFRPLAMIVRLMRSSMLESLTADYIRTAAAKGLSEWSIVFKHALKNSWIPVITLLGPIGANLITGSFLVETVFQIPGLGKHFVTAVLNRDYPLVMGVTLFYGVLLMGANLLVDLSYHWADPRMKENTS